MYSAIVGTQFTSTLRLHLHQQSADDKTTSHHLATMKNEMVPIRRGRKTKGPHWQALSNVHGALSQLKWSAVMKQTGERKRGK